MNAIAEQIKATADRLAAEPAVTWADLGAVLHGLVESDVMSTMLKASTGSADALSANLVALGVNVVVADHLTDAEQLAVAQVMGSPSVANGTVAQATILGSARPTEAHQVSRALRMIGAHWHASQIIEIAAYDPSEEEVGRYLEGLADQIETDALRDQFDRMIAERARERQRAGSLRVSRR